MADDETTKKVAEALKQNIAKKLITEDQTLASAGHGSHVVSAMFEPGPSAPEDLGGTWDEAKFQGFVKKLTENMNPEKPK